jgi:hypothetical protein
VSKANVLRDLNFVQKFFVENVRMYMNVVGAKNQIFPARPFDRKVARWYIFIPKIPISGYFGRTWNRKLGTFCCFFAYVNVIRNIFGRLVHFFSFFVYCAKENLAALFDHTYSVWNPCA